MWICYIYILWYILPKYILFFCICIYVFIYTYIIYTYLIHVNTLNVYNILNAISTNDWLKGAEAFKEYFQGILLCIQSKPVM